MTESSAFLPIWFALFSFVGLLIGLGISLYFDLNIISFLLTTISCTGWLYANVK